MDGGFNLISTLTLLGAAQGLFLALALVNAKSGNTGAHRILALFTLLFSIDLGEEFLYQTGFFASVPGLLNVPAPIDLLYGPLIYLYVCQLTSPPSSESVTGRYRHFIPVLVGIVLLLPFFTMDSANKLEFTESVRRGEFMEIDSAQALMIRLGFTLFMLATIVQLGLYLLLSIRRLAAHARSIRNQFSDIDRISLDWLSNLLLGLGCIFLLYLLDQILPDLMGVNVLGDAITVVAVVLIYAMGYLGIRQPAIFTQAFVPRHSAAAGDASAAQGKYRRSGLDRETSRLFLDALADHMQANKPYLEGDLVLPQLAQQLGISANYLSQVINQQLNVNFYDFVNGYRIEEARRLMQSAGQERVNILKIALDSGFNSKSAFYTAFKKATAMTPSEYRKTL